MNKQSFSDFEAQVQAGQSCLIWQEYSADLETPVACYMKLADDQPYGFLLESIEGGATRGRYSFIGMEPDLIWRCQGNHIRVTGKHNTQDFESENPLYSLKELLTEMQDLAFPEHLPPMACGMVGYFGYENIRHFEAIHHTNPDPLGLPDGLFIRPKIMVIFDHVTDRMTLATPIWQDQHQAKPNLTELWEQAQARLQAVHQKLLGSLPVKPSPVKPSQAQTDTASPKIIADMPPETYQEMVERAKDYILAGDIFQVVLSQRFSADYSGDPFTFYRALRHINPAPFLFYLKFDDFSIAGSSPEILVRVRDDIVTVRPLAGSRKRGETTEEDQALANDLLNDPKELAEHLMLVDLGRNDVGRVAKADSVRVTEQFKIERYSHVMHIVSNVEGELRDDKTVFDALFAGFPVGTVSGAPKVRAMEIIEELEPFKRGVYAGCVGYFSADGSMDSCIALRTAILKDHKVYFQTGAGIVADSDPVAEQKECEAKANALFLALERATKAFAL